MEGNPPLGAAIVRGASNLPAIWNAFSGNKRLRKVLGPMLTTTSPGKRWVHRFDLDKPAVREASLRATTRPSSSTAQPAAAKRGRKVEVPAKTAKASGAGTGTPPGDIAPIALLYHQDAAVRIETIKELSKTGDLSLIDDLIRAHSVEFYTPVHNVYASVLRSMTAQRGHRTKGQWKTWLAGQAAAGRLAVDYQPVELADLVPKDRLNIQPLALRFGPEHFGEMAAALTAKQHDRRLSGQALRYMVANDHRKEVQAFLKSNWLGKYLVHRDADIVGVGYHMNGLANPGPIRARIDEQVRDCLDSPSATVVTNALHLLAGVEGNSTVFVVPDVADSVRMYCSGFLGIGAVLDFDENRSDRQRDRRSRNDGHKV